MSKLYTSVPVPKFPQNTFNLSRSAVGSMSFHKMYCTECIEVIPGDGFVAGTETFGRAEPMVAPPMARQDCDHHTFFVPDWQLNNHFDDFITGGEKYDFTSHMPFVYVSDIYNLVHGLLDPDNLPTVAVIPDTTQARRQLVKECNFRTDLALRILEHCDWLRAVPFTKPDFLPPIVFDGTTTRENVEEYMNTNLQAFYGMNYRLEGAELRVNLLPFAAYLKTWCEFFRDENLSPDFWDFINSDDSAFRDYATSFKDCLDYVGQVCTDLVADLPTIVLSPVFEDLPTIVRSDFWKDWELFALKPRAWRKDRYTASLPWTQKGPDVLIPLGGVFDVQNSGPTSGSIDVWFNGANQDFRAANGSAESKISQNIDLSQNRGQGSTIRDLRRAFASESFVEADGQFGNRYPENTLGQFGVFTPDSRLPRSQFIGSNTQNFVTSEIAQTSESGDTPQGNLAGKGTIYGSHKLFRGVYTQHGFIIVFSSLRVQALYESGIHPMFSRFDRTEYAWPRFARLGEEPLYTKELYVSGQNNQDKVTEDEVFGYVPRYSSYKSDQSSVHGLLKGSQNFWTFSRRFGSKPKLNEEFIYNKPRLDAFAVVNPYDDQFKVEIDFHVRSRRKLPYWGTPMI